VTLSTLFLVHFWVFEKLFKTRPSIQLTYKTPHTKHFRALQLAGEQFWIFGLVALRGLFGLTKNTICYYFEVVCVSIDLLSKFHLMDSGNDFFFCLLAWLKKMLH